MAMVNKNVRHPGQQCHDFLTAALLNQSRLHLQAPEATATTAWLEHHGHCVMVGHTRDKESRVLGQALQSTSGSPLAGAQHTCTSLLC